MSETKATIIFKQIGGARFSLMTGARNWIDTGDGIQFDFRGSRKVNKCKVELNSRDLYDVTFYQYRPKSVTCPEIETRCDLYADSLKGVFEDVTGLLTTL